MELRTEIAVYFIPQSQTSCWSDIKAVATWEVDGTGSITGLPFSMYLLSGIVFFFYAFVVYTGLNSLSFIQMNLSQTIFLYNYSLSGSPFIY